MRRFLSILALSEHHSFHTYQTFKLFDKAENGIQMHWIERVSFCTDKLSAKKNVLHSGCLIVRVRVFPDFLQHFNIIISYEDELNMVSIWEHS